MMVYYIYITIYNDGLKVNISFLTKNIIINRITLKYNLYNLSVPGWLRRSWK